MTRFGIGERAGYGPGQGVDLLRTSSESGLHLVRNRHQMGTPTEDGRYVQTFFLIITGDNQEADIRELEEYLRQGERYHDLDGDVIDPMFLHESTDDETGAGPELQGARVALIWAYTFQSPPSDMVYSHLRLEDGDVVRVLTITRGAWEDNQSTVDTAMGDKSSGTKWPVPGVGGTLPSRIERVSIRPRTGGSHQFNRMWLGMRFNPGTVDTKQELAGPLHNNVIHIGNSTGSLDICSMRTLACTFRALPGTWSL